MAARLPDLEREDFVARLQELSPEPLSGRCLTALWAHYLELRRWSPVLSLIGPGTAEEVLVRHYGESLAALPLLEETARRLVDLGSGAGFPGFVLAAARPSLEVVLVEARQRKWAFLEAAARKAALPLTCLNARVGHPLPAELALDCEVVTLRALRLPAKVLTEITRCLGPDGQLLVWVGGDSPVEVPGFSVRRTVPLAGSRRRRLLDLRRQGG